MTRPRRLIPNPRNPRRRCEPSLDRRPRARPCPPAWASPCVLAQLGSRALAGARIRKQSSRGATGAGAACVRQADRVRFVLGALIVAVLLAGTVAALGDVGRGGGGNGEGGPKRFRSRSVKVCANAELMDELRELFGSDRVRLVRAQG